MKYVTLALLAPLIAFAQANATTEEQESVGVCKSKSSDGGPFGDMTEEQMSAGVLKLESPDGRYFGAMRRMPDDGLIWDNSFDGFRLVIFPIQEKNKSRGELYFAFDLGRRLPDKVKWTADSKFLVFTTKSSAGHSPWHSTTYAFSVSAKKIVCVDDVIGLVIDSDFKLEGPHTGTFKIGKRGPEELDLHHPELVKLDISRLFSGDPKGKIEPAGTAK